MTGLITLIFAAFVEKRARAAEILDCIGAGLGWDPKPHLTAAIPERLVKDLGSNYIISSSTDYGPVVTTLTLMSALS